MSGAAAERGERIAKWLARAGVASRRDAEKLLAEGVVQVNGARIDHPATFIGVDDVVQVRGKVVDAPERSRLWRYHKPEGLVTTHRDPEDRPTVFQALPPTLPRVVSVGRLDLNSEGLLLLTNDGALARRLELPSNGWIRRYRARAWGVVDPAALARLSQGVVIEGVRYGPIEASLEVRKGENVWLAVALREGRNREVRRVLAHLGLTVSRLIRVAYGPFQLGVLPRGAVDEVPGKVLREQVPDGLRIVGGAWRGRGLVAPAGAGTRPTADRVRQAVFDRLMHAPWAAGVVAGASVLDVFAGTGALGLEALSRGAGTAVFMERERGALAALRANIAACGAGARAMVVAGDVLRPPVRGGGAGWCSWIRRMGWGWWGRLPLRWGVRGGWRRGRWWWWR